MHPTLIDLGQVRLPFLGETHLFLPTYGVLFAAGALVAWTWFFRRGKGMGLPEDALFNLGFYSILAGLLGAKMAVVVVDLPLYLRDPALILGTIRSAGVLMGGVLAGALVFIGYARRHGLPVLALGDAAVAPVALAQAVGRLGCFSAGCCYGVPVDHRHPLAITFTDPMAAAQTGVPLHVPLFASQPVQAVHDLVLAAILTVLWRRRLPTGTAVAAYLMLYGVGRAILEIWRGDAARGTWFGGAVSTSQVLSAVAFIAGVALLVHVRRTRPGEKAA
jgi:phosphatidylglycerol:prolipoprotein diacylglycerol transferase